MQTKSVIVMQIKQIIANDLDVNIKESDINDDSPLFDGGIGLDSIAMINFIVLIEKKFDINFDDSEMSSNLFLNVDTLADFIVFKVNGGLTKTLTS